MFLESIGAAIDRPALSTFLERRGPHVTDLALAWACSRGDEGAARYFEREVLPSAAQALARLGHDASLRDDVVSWLRGELFGRERGSSFAGYSGKSPLEGWLRVIAVNEAMRRNKRRVREVEADVADAIPVPEANLNALQGAHGQAFTTALREAFAALSIEQRNLLRQSFLDGLSIDALAKVHGVHRATVARRIVAAKDALTAGVRERLQERLGIGASTADGLVTLENLEESLPKLLRETKR